MALRDGQSELDTAVLRVEGLSFEVKTWDKCTIREDFISPTAAFDFTLSTNDPTLYNQIFVAGAKIEIAINDRLQSTGYIERVRKSHSRASGTTYQISGRDILGPVVSASIDPKIKITSNQTVADFLYAILGQFGIDTIYVGDDKNYNIVTGYPKGRGKAQTQTFTVKEATSRVVSSDGKSAEVQFKTATVTQVISRNRPDLKNLPLDQLKPRIGEGAYQLIDRLLSRLGLRMWAAADGSGVIVDAPDFTTPAIHKVIRQFDGAANNVLDGESNINVEIQPSCIVAVGHSSGADLAKTKLKCIAVNELVAVNTAGQPVKSAANIIARYPGVTVLPIRQELVPKEDRIVSVFTQKPMFIKDDESKTIDQLAAFARRQLAMKQKEYLVATYTVMGHTYAGYPWAVNTLVDVDDDYLGIHEPLWCVERTFIKSRSEGTLTQLKLIKPHTLQLGV
ncbi:phage baseplate assembly protein [Polyangium spumosum]|uniref:Baseplate hub protein gp44-like N-terminal domain-containing protein n=1 Tax=Polyangium spumosum TaxID=889282 RepID=A0A6N7Q4N2_9BACT|nr:hypothetical protein [Polyangium spumosum]MRG98206.1 hypothetical protein [Polyangium spumosum]